MRAFKRVRVGTRFRDRAGNWRPRPIMRSPVEHWIWMRSIPLRNLWGRLNAHVRIEYPSSTRPVRHLRGWQYMLICWVKGRRMP